jgi:hypothetical protein
MAPWSSTHSAADARRHKACSRAAARTGGPPDGRDHRMHRRREPFLVRRGDGFTEQRQPVMSRGSDRLDRTLAADHDQTGDPRSLLGSPLLGSPSARIDEERTP